MKPYIAHIRANLRLMGRDRSVLFFNYFFPLIFFVIFAISFGGAKNPAGISQVVDMVLVLGVLGSGFFGAGMRAVQDRESNILRRYKVTPTGPAPIIVASLVSGLVSFLPSVFIVVLLGHVWLQMPLPARPLDFLIFVSLGSLAFRAMGMIVAAVVNSSQESQIVTQIIYLPMLFLSGATFPLQLFPHWLQIATQFVPATYLFQGMQSIFLMNATLASNWLPALSLVVTMIVAVFLGVKLFRWEKGEKIAASGKLWVLVVMLPFFLMGLYQSKSQKNLTQEKVLARNMVRSQTTLFQNARIFVGDGHVILNGAVLVRRGKIAQVFDTPPADTKALKADVVDASGKTLLPGLIDMHVHLGSPGGIYQNASDYTKEGAELRELAAYLYSGITAVRSVGDRLDSSLEWRQAIESNQFLGAELFTCGPMFTVEGGHGTQYARYLPANIRQKFNAQITRTPHSVTEARQQVNQLKQKGVDCVKAVLESGAEGMPFNRMNTSIYDAVVAAAKANNLPVATHTGDSRDVQDAIQAGGASTIEHGSTRDQIPAEVFRAMAAKGIVYDPALSVAEALGDLQNHDLTLLDRSLVQQVAPRSLLDSTRSVLSSPGATSGFRGIGMGHALDIASQNLVAAWKSGVTLTTGSDAGDLLVIHGPTIQRELALWVKAGIPPGVALRAATLNAARVLRTDNRIGSIETGKDATLILVEGNPLDDISSMERVTYVMFKGEHVDRSGLLRQESE
jgi:imidazolonepropionase-like amidohydrolase/ABC-type multidrug transport system permease subunit